MKRELPPKIDAYGNSIADAWEDAILKLNARGLVYERDDPQDLGPQVSSMMNIEIRFPDADPIVHKKGGTNVVCAPALDYCMEMLGSRNPAFNIRNFGDKNDTRWDYTYHERLADYPNGDNPSIDQLAWATGRLIERPSSRRTNLITWNPLRDMKAKDTPCLQRIWFQIVNDMLDMHYSFRSRNALDASHGNMLGLYVLGCDTRDKIEQATGRELGMRMIDTTDDFHVNAKAYPRFKNIAKTIKQARANGEERGFTRADLVDTMLGDRDSVEERVFQPIAQYFAGHPEDERAERARIHSIGDRVFYLLDKYGPKTAK